MHWRFESWITLYQTWLHIHYLVPVLVCTLPNTSHCYTFIALYQWWFAHSLPCTSDGLHIHYLVPYMVCTFIALYQWGFAHSLPSTSDGLHIHCLVPVMVCTFIALYQWWFAHSLPCTSDGLHIHCLVPVMVCTFITLYQWWLTHSLPCPSHGLYIHYLILSLFTHHLIPVIVCISFCIRLGCTYNGYCILYNVYSISILNGKMMHSSQRIHNFFAWILILQFDELIMNKLIHLINYVHLRMRSRWEIQYKVNHE